MLFNIMPTITKTKGMATINIGCIILSLIEALDSLWILEEGGGRNRNTVAVKPAPNSMPLLRMCPVFYLLRAITALENAINSSAFRDSVTSPGKDCCPIVDSFEKNFSRKKDVLQVKHDRGNAKG